MLFNSFSFVLFFLIVFIIYWFALGQKTKSQNIFLLIASYFFYGCWDWRFTFLLATSTILCYVGGNLIYNADSDKKRKIWVATVVTVNLLFLGIFKYFNFFIESFQDFLALFGITNNHYSLYIILPVGISFYTFHGLSYVIDIYYKKWLPTPSWIDYSLFVAFFPLLVAGPIERATHLLPQIEKKRSFSLDKAYDGLRQILWGLFKKIVIADGCAIYVNQIFDNSEHQPGSALILAAILFAFQIYGDFSGYSDIALGTARLLGFELLQNFNFPYFSRDIAEFWRRWHISLSSWFRDYIYIPLGGSRKGMAKTIRNTFIIFLVSGFWHGANWTFVMWGGLHALYIVPSILVKRNRKNIDIVAKGKLIPSLKDAANILITFSLVVLAWILFRADNIQHAYSYLQGIPKNIFVSPELSNKSIISIIMVIIMICVEWYGREGKYALEFLKNSNNKIINWSVYYFIIILLFMFAAGEQAFIYFQF